MLRGSGARSDKLAECVHGLERVINGQRESFHRTGTVVAFVEDEWNEAIVFESNLVDCERVARGLAGERRVHRMEPRRARHHRHRLADDLIGETRAARGFAQRVDCFNQFTDALARAGAQDRAVFDDDERKRIGAQGLSGKFQICHGESLPPRRRDVKHETRIAIRPLRFTFYVFESKISGRRGRQ